MSIPPLVCSTPPPPDQCEDDKDPEDFEIQYNSSQEDDYDNFDYGSFTNYSHFQTAQSKEEIPVISKIVQNKMENSIPDNISSEPVLEPRVSIENKLKSDEIEDLDLKIEAETTEEIDSFNVSSCENIIASNIDKVTEKEIELISNDADILLKDDYLVSRSNSDHTVEEPSTSFNEMVGADNEIQLSELNTTCGSETLNSDTVSDCFKIDKTEIEKEIVDDDDFGDFDDFHVPGTIEKSVKLVDDCENPWDTKVVEQNNFGEFEANFNANEEIQLFNAPTDCSVDNKAEILENDDEDDDFGDFNDFKSSTANSDTIVVNEEPTIEQQVSVLNLHSTDNEGQLMESINKVINEVFPEDVPVPDTDYEGKLDTILGETWGHLLRIDERQPYMVNWNNSLGQKFLLKALCIDSRNILFGPKWNYNAPKYAVNLTAAPLQPQKQAATSSLNPSEAVAVDKTAVKSSGNWNEPFASDGQESCNPELSANNPVIEAGPTDLAVFEASTSNKADKIFSSTLNVQPIRQINLPDTHIFTPLDSETPRSTTIHYDSSPTVILPQQVVEIKSVSNFMPDTTTAVTNSPEKTDDYWEFQDYKSPPSTATNTTATLNDIDQSNTSLSYGIQLLQPIKMEPVIPTLNWPDPGEVKETFDDFSDFISNTSTSSNNHVSAVTPNDSRNIEPLEIVFNKTQANAEKPIALNDNLDDEFDTFQSALPSKSSTGLNSTNESILEKQQNVQTDFKHVFSKEDMKTVVLSYDIPTISKENIVQAHEAYFPNNLETARSAFNTKSLNNSVTSTVPTVSVLPVQTSLLQPTPANPSSILQNQQKSAQILQPLSLESYSQINWPNPGLDLQDLSRFNPVDTLHSLKTDLNVNSQSKSSSPVQNKKTVSNQAADDDMWGDFVSSRPKPLPQQAIPKKQPSFPDDDEWTDFVSSPSVKPQNGLNTISLNVHTNLNIQKSNSSKYNAKSNTPLDIPSLNYITPKASNQKTYNDRHFQNL